MSTAKHASPRDHLDAALTWARARIAGISDDQLDDPTPCDEWSVRQVVAHLVDVIGALPAALATGEAAAPHPDAVGSGSATVEAGLEAYDRNADAARRALADDPEVLHRKLASPMGDVPAGRLAMLAFGDALVHGWDLARATGQDEVMPPDLVEPAYRMWRQMPLERFRAGGSIGDERQVPDGASTQDRMLALLGRTPG